MICQLPSKTPEKASGDISICETFCSEGSHVLAARMQCLDQAIRIEVDANVAGAPLTPLDMAVFLAAHKELYDRENPEAAQGKAGAHGRWNATDKMSVASFAANAAEVFSKGERQIFRLISVGEKLSKDEIAQLRKAPNKVQFKDLEHIAKCSEQADRSAICAALGAGEAKTAKEVLDRKKAAGAAVQSPLEQQVSKLKDAYGRGIGRAEPGANVYPQTNVTEDEYKT